VIVVAITSPWLGIESAAFGVELRRRAMEQR